MVSVSYLYLAAIVWPVLSLIAVAIWMVVKFPAHGNASEEEEV